MKTFVIVFHHFWMGCKGFENEVIERENEKQAWEYAHAKAYRKSRAFNDCSATVLEIQQGERIYPPRKLTYRERVSGSITC